MKHGGKGGSGLKKGVSMCEGFSPSSASPPESKTQQRPKVDTSQGPKRTHRKK